MTGVARCAGRAPRVESGAHEAATPGLAPRNRLAGRLFATLVMVAGALAVAAPAYPQIADPVQLDAGLISGGPMSSTGIRVFKGIPFAAPPVGNLRWRPPQPVTAWDGVRQADEFGNVCIQPPGMGRLNIAVLEDSPPLDEDCLYLNVWTGADSTGERRPVMVYAFGGAFTEGGGSVALYDGTRLAEKGAVVVTLNYRLGPFGFFVHPDLAAESGHNAAGNYGLMDVVAVLRWVQANIAAFGGDQANVTLFGQSAGAMMVAVLAASPEAKGLFHRGIAQSAGWMGLTMMRMRTRAQTGQQGLEAAEQLGAPSVAELRALPADEITALRGAGIIVDGWIIPEDLSIVFEEGRQNDVDVLVGSTRDEGSFFAGGPSTGEWESQVRGRWGDLAEQLLALYPPDRVEESFPALFSDELAWQMRLLGERQADRGNRSYAYYFAYSPPVDPGIPSLGAAHAAEIPYVFNNLGQLPLYPDNSSPELAAASGAGQALADLMSSYWVNFASRGDPNGEGLPEWPPFVNLMSSPAMVLAEEAAPEAALPTEKFTLFNTLYERQLESLAAN